MKNLAGDKGCDTTITAELNAAGIQLVRHSKPLKQEVPASVTGKLCTFTFTRAWYYWMVSGKVPLDVANEMYETAVGMKDVRVAGNCGCPPPHEWAFPLDEELHPQLELLQLEHVNFGELAKLCDSGKIKGVRYVGSYHIDSQEGLNLFTATLRKHGLV